MKVNSSFTLKTNYSRFKVSSIIMSLSFIYILNFLNNTNRVTTSISGTDHDQQLMKHHITIFYML